MDEPVQDTFADATPFGIGQVLERGVWLVFENLMALLPIIAAMFALFLVQFGVSMVVQFGALQEPDLEPLWTLVSMGSSFLGGLVSLFVHIALMRMLLTLDRNEEATLDVAFGTAVGQFLPVLLVSFLMGVVTTIGMLFCILPGIYLAVALSPVTFVLLNEPLGPIESLQRAWELTDGRRLELFLIYLVIGVAMMLTYCISCGLLLPLATVVQASVGVVAYRALAAEYQYAA